MLHRSIGNVSVGSRHRSCVATYDCGGVYFTIVTTPTEETETITVRLIFWIRFPIDIVSSKAVSRTVLNCCALWRKITCCHGPSTCAVTRTLP
eukprot:UN32961